MNLKNYTSTVPASRSIMLIEHVLVGLNASNITKEYDNKILTGITFTVLVNNQTIPFKIPAKIAVIEKILKQEVKRPKPETFARIKEQAERTAWKIIFDWVEIQASVIQMQQAEFLEVFLPYVFNLESGQTFFEKIKGGNFKALGTGTHG